MNMSMDKPMALHTAEGTRGPQVENVKIRSKKRFLRHGNANMNMSMDKPMALHITEGTRGPQVQNCKNEVKKDIPRGISPYQNFLSSWGGYPPHDINLISFF